MSDERQLSVHLRDFNSCDASLEVWLVLRSSGLAFDAHCHPEGEAIRAEAVPLGQLPVLIASDCPVWDSLAIAELIAELQPAMWPLDPRKRARARSIASELHSGFAGIRRLLPLDLLGHFDPPGKLTRATQADVQRMIEICECFCEASKEEGPFLFGEFSIVDAFMTPVAARIVTYSIEVQETTSAYVDTLMAWPPMTEWLEHASRRIEDVAAGKSPASLVNRWSYPGADPTAIEPRDMETRIPTAFAPPEVIEKALPDEITGDVEPVAEEPDSGDAPLDPGNVPESARDDVPDSFGRDPSLDLTIYERPEDAGGNDEDEADKDRVTPPEPAGTVSEPEKKAAIPDVDGDSPAFERKASPPEDSGKKPSMPPPPRARDLPWLRKEEVRTPDRPGPAGGMPSARPTTTDGEHRVTGPGEAAQERKVTIQPIGAGTRRRR
ncbi:MAG: hypothetical protein R3C97_12675 [Geminicoccaceae bacterium]